MTKIIIEGNEGEPITIDDVNEFIVFTVSKAGGSSTHINSSLAARCFLEKLLKVDNETRIYRTYVDPNSKDTD